MILWAKRCLAVGLTLGSQGWEHLSALVLLCCSWTFILCFVWFCKGCSLKLMLFKGTWDHNCKKCNQLKVLGIIYELFMLSWDLLLTKTCLSEIVNNRHTPSVLRKHRGDFDTNQMFYKWAPTQVFFPIWRVGLWAPELYWGHVSLTGGGRMA